MNNRFAILLFVLLGSWCGSASGGLVNRWSFTTAAGNAVAGTTFLDTVSGTTPLVVRGNGAVLTGTTIILPGGTNGNQTAAAIAAYLDLPNGIISSKTDLTVEAWATPLSAQNWMRVFDFGRVNTSGIGGGAVTLSGTASGASQFYRLILQPN